VENGFLKEGIALADGSLVNLVNIWEPVGAACLGVELFPAGRVGQKAKRVCLEDAWRMLCSVMATWRTLPEEVQTDGDPVLVAPKGAFPSLFTLRLVGLGIHHLVVHKPTLQAEVERGHRTLNEYAVVGNEHLPLEPLRRVLKVSQYELVFELPSHAKGCAGRPPIQAYPELLQPPHPFQSEYLQALFHLHRVDTYLATLSWERKVQKNGRVRLGQKRQYYTVGTQYAGQEVNICFDPIDRCLIFSLSDQPDQVIARRAVKQLTEGDILGWETNLNLFGPQQLKLPLFEGVSG
jgi:hypothetical protein